MQMNGINELITVAHRHEGWADPRLVVMIVHNNDLNEVTWLMRMQGKMPKYEPSQTLPDLDFAGFARMLGLEGIRVDSPDQVAGACERALSCGRPAVLDVLSDPTVALVSPQVTEAMVSSMAAALERGDADERRFGADRFRQHLSSEGFPVDQLDQKRKQS
jgi:pyruvate dehydrogenase (quinone)